MSNSTKLPKAGAKIFTLEILPTRECLNEAISYDGFCDPRKCWHFVAINAMMERLEPSAKHHVRVDGGHIKLNYRGWRYIADTPRHVKRSLMLFDLHRYNEVNIRKYSLRFRRTTKIIPVTRERQDQINAARIAAGKPVHRVYDLKKRIEGFSGSV